MHFALKLFLCAVVSCSFSTGLRCEDRDNPLCVDTAKPRLGWVATTATPLLRGLWQTAYQVLVATLPTTLPNNQGDLWNSGRVTSSHMYPMAYAGRALSSHSSVFWKIRLWNQDGNFSVWSPVAKWTMGVLQEADGHGAQWIGGPGASEPFDRGEAKQAKEKYKTVQHADTHACGTGSEGVDCLPLAFGMVDAARLPAVLNRLVRDPLTKGMAVSEVSFRYLLRALAGGGLSDVIYSTYSIDTDGYGLQVKLGKASLTEAWNGGNASQNHFMFGQINEWFYHDLAGLRCGVDGPGFEKIVIQPTLVGDLTAVSAGHRSMRGDIASARTHDSSVQTMKVVIPVGSTALDHGPAADPATVRESGLPTASAPGVKSLRLENGTALYAVGSGVYTFSSADAPPASAEGALPSDGHAAPPTIRPGELWPDDRGQHVEAHGGGITKVGDTYYWFGEDRSRDNPPGKHYVACYASRDLVQWQFRHQVVQLADPEHLSDIDGHWVLERPKVFYNAKTRKYVMYVHLDGRGGYKFASVGVLTCDRPDGDYQYVRSFRPLGKESRDIGQFVDDDGSAYLIFESRPVKGFYIAKLSDDYLDVAKEVCLIHAPLEGGAVVHYNGLYYAIGSALTGWRPNPNKYATAPALEGPWSDFEDIAPPETNTYGSQSTLMLKVVGTKATTVIFMGDLWHPAAQWDSRYLWMPLKIAGVNLSLPEPKPWTLDVHTGEAVVLP